MKREAEDDVDALATDISALDLDVELPGTDPRAKEEYTRALDSYERGRTALGRAHRPAELEAVASALEEGRFAMESAKARIQGRRPPERTPPCFFDPRHGPSSREVEWNPPGGAPRPVPACEADAQRVEAGLEPIAREVAVNGARVPYWNAPPAFAPYVGGYFGGFAGILPGLLVGSLLGSAFGFGGWDTDAGGAGGDFTDAGGDFGGGDFGGGDFGGEWSARLQSCVRQPRGRRGVWG